MMHRFLCCKWDCKNMHKQTVKRLATCAAVMIVGSLFGATRTEAMREKLISGDRDYVFVAMHRGDWRNFPENSKGAILSSIRLGAAFDIPINFNADANADVFEMIR